MKSGVARWWGPVGFSSTIHAFDFQPGGDWRLTLHGPDGTDYPNHNRFARIEPDRLLVIDHGRGYMSLYGHNQSLLRQVGQSVEQGEPVVPWLGTVLG